MGEGEFGRAQGSNRKRKSSGKVKISLNATTSQKEYEDTSSKRRSATVSFEAKRRSTRLFEYD